jgi:hypothetical protein
MGSVNPFEHGLLFQMLGKDKESGNSNGAKRVQVGNNTSPGNPLSGLGRNPSNNPKSLNNGLGSQVASENSANSLNAPSRRKSLI